MLITHNIITALLVDDDRLLAALYKRAAPRYRIDLHTASRGEAAIDILRAGLRPHVILLDIDMPVMNGIEVVRVIRAEQLVPLSSIILIAPDHPEAHSEELESLGIDEHVRKWARFPSDILHRVANHYGGIDPQPGGYVGGRRPVSPLWT